MVIHPPLSIQIDGSLWVVLSNLTTRLKTGMKTVAVAEYGTGGLLTFLLASAAAGSPAFRRGWVTQDRQALMEELAVPRAVIESYGIHAVETARWAARGARLNAGASYGIGLVANAGPGTDDGAAAGTVFVVVSHGSTFTEEKYQIKGPPAQVRSEAVVSAAMLLGETTRLAR